jgi:hypothetical protein
MLRADGREREQLTAEEARRQRSGEGEAVIPERSIERRGHGQAREHEPDQDQPCRAGAEIEVVRDPGDVGPRSPHRKEQDCGLEPASQRQVVQQVARELGDGEDVHEVEEQLDRRDLRRSLARLSQVRWAPITRFGSCVDLFRHPFGASLRCSR